MFGFMVGAWVGCELKSIRAVLKCLQLTSDGPKHFWILEGSVCNTLLIAEMLEHTDKQKYLN